MFPSLLPTVQPGETVANEAVLLISAYNNCGSLGSRDIYCNGKCGQYLPRDKVETNQILG